VILEAGALQSNGSLQVIQGGSLDYVGGTLRAEGLLEIRGGHLSLTPSRNKVVRAGDLDMSLAARLDLSDNHLHVDYAGTTPILSIAAMITSGYNNGAWTGDGVASSAAAANIGFALGYSEAVVMPSIPAVFGAVDDTSILVSYTRYGDADLSGHVNLDDFNRLAAHFNQSGFWSNGDFNYDGVVNLPDFNLLAANFNLSAGFGGPTPEDWANLAAAVPEPAALALFLALPMWHRRRGNRVS
jgi:hypothetical protein